MEEAERKKREIKTTSGILCALCLLAIPFTGGGSLAALGATAGIAATAAISTEIVLAIITAVVSISTTAIIAIKEYNIRKLEYNRIELTRR